jgi:predicted GIY-YIG superfamily endonuclease
MKIYVYMLLCADGSYYVGVARHGLDKRLAEHRSGHCLRAAYQRMAAGKEKSPRARGL